MTYIVCDDSLEGLFSAIYDAYYTKPKADGILLRETFEPNLVDCYIHSERNQEKSLKVVTAIKEKISSLALTQVIDCYLSEIDNYPQVIYEYLRLGFKIGYEVDMCLTEPSVDAIKRCIHKINFEKHRFLGLMRFVELKEGILMATFVSDHNILGFMAEHFCERMPNERWIIADEKRGLVAIYNKPKWFLETMNKEDIGTLKRQLSDDEISFQSLWQTYHKSIAIEERKNLKLQRQFIPKRYWPHLVEEMG